MIIGVISDTHGSLTAWEKARERVFNSVDLIVHCGDIFYHGVRNPLPEGYDTLALANAFNAESSPLLFVKGNCDSAVDQLVMNYPLQSPYLQIFSEERLLIFSHEPMDNWEVMLQGSPGAIFVHWHTHIPVIEKTECGFYLLNPGSASLPKDEYPPTVAVIEIHPSSLNIKIIDIEALEIIKALAG